MPDTPTLFPFMDVALQIAALTVLSTLALLYGLPRLGALQRRRRRRRAVVMLSLHGRGPV